MGWGGTVGVGWGGSSLGGVNFSNASPKYLQPENLISAVIIHQFIIPVTPPMDSLGFPFHSGLPV